MSDTAFVVVPPITLTTPNLVASNVPENDYPEWTPRGYALGERVMILAEHKVYECVRVHATPEPPGPDTADYWILVGFTNRWRAFDLINASQTRQADSITYTIVPGASVTAFAALNLTGCLAINVRMVAPGYGEVYNTTINTSPLVESPDWYDWYFGEWEAPSLSVLLDLPTFVGATIYLEFIGSADLGVGTILLGSQLTFGSAVQYGARVGIKDYSRKEVNEWGETVLDIRKFSKRANFSVELPKAQVDPVFNLLADLRAKPCLYIGSSCYESTILFGFYRDFDILIAYPTYSVCTLDLEGLT